MTLRAGFIPPYFFDHLPKNTSAAAPHQPALNLSSNKAVAIHNGFYDSNIKSALKNGEIVLKFLKEIFGRDSFDNKGSQLVVYLHARGVDNNARWYKGVVYIGDVVETGSYASLAKYIETLAHEIGYGIIQHTAKLKDNGQSGTLGKSWCDIMTSLVKQYARKEKAAKADWLIGNEFVKDLTGEAQSLRSMKEPGRAYEFPQSRDPQVNHMDYYDQSSLDSVAVHINSGILNKVFYTFAMEFPELPSWKVAGLIWYKALCLSNPDTTFGEFAQLTFRAIDDCSLPKSVKSLDVTLGLSKAWQAVGISVDARMFLEISHLQGNEHATESLLFKNEESAALLSKRRFSKLEQEELRGRQSRGCCIIV